MTLPTFLGIGAPRCGSTWLHELLASHPDVYVPVARKEVRFFDLYYDRGLLWYEQFFPGDIEASRYQAVGELSPTYLYCPECPQRIADVPSITKLLLIVRNPVDRAYSRYGFHVQYEGFSGSFEHFLARHPYAIEEGLYEQSVKQYHRYFKREQMLTLVYEHSVAEVAQTKEALARFLCIAADRFPENTGTEVVHRSYLPKRGRAVYAFLTAIARKLQEQDMDWAVGWARRVRIRRLFGEGRSLPPMKEETRRHLKSIYEKQITELESLLQIDLSCWQ
jgi:hypothetical protein